MELLVLLAGIAILLILILVFKIHAFLSLLITALSVGLMQGMGFEGVLKSVSNGVGSTMGSLIIVVVLGAMLGKALSMTGATEQISASLIKLFGLKNVKFAMMLTGLIVGIAMYYNAGFVVLIPLVFLVSQQTGLPLVYTALPLCTALSVTHGFLPPHPGPTAIVGIFKADMGKTLLYGLIITVPAVLAGGLIFPEFVKTIKAVPSPILTDSKSNVDQKPGFGLSLLIAISPVVLMAIASACEILLPAENTFRQFFHFLGDPNISLLIAALLAIYILPAKGKVAGTMAASIEAISTVAVILLVIAAGGAFKQVLVDSGIGQKIADQVKNWQLSTLVLGWLIAAILRVILGSATVAGMTAAGIIGQVIISSGASPELCVLAVGAGSLFLSHLNDTGFWMFKEYFGLSVKDTLKTWSAMESIVSVMGLLGVLVLDQFV